MKIRIKYSSSLKFVVELPQPEPSLSNLRDVVLKFVSKNYGEDRPNLVLLFSLNGIDPLIGDDSQSLASLGVVNNDLLTVLLVSPKKGDQTCKGAISPSVTEQSSSASMLQLSSGSANTLNTSLGNLQNKSNFSDMCSNNKGSGNMTHVKNNEASKAANLLDAKDGEPPTSVMETFEQYSPSTASQVLTLLTHITMLESGFFVQDGESSLLKTLPISWKEMVSTIPYHHPGFHKFDCTIVLVTMGSIKQILASFEGQESELCIKFNIKDYLLSEEISPYQLTKLSQFAKEIRNKLLYPLQIAAHETLGLPAPWHLAGLPQEVLMKITRYLDLKAILSLATSCKRLFSACQDNKLWFVLFKRDFPNHSHSSDKVSGADWKAKYMTMNERIKSDKSKADKKEIYVVPDIVPMDPRHGYPNPYHPPYMPQPRAPDPIYPPQPDLPNGPFWDPDNPYFGGDIPVNPGRPFPYAPHPFDDPFRRTRPRRPFNPFDPPFGPPGFNPDFGPRFL